MRVGGASIDAVDELVGGEVAVASTGLNFDALGALSAFSEFGPDSELSHLDVNGLGSNLSSGIGIVITASNIADAIDELEAGFREDAANAAIPVKESDIEATRVLIVAGDQATGVAGSVMAILDDAVILGSVVEDVRPFIQANAGAVPALASDPDFQQTMAQLPAETLIAGYAPAPQDSSQ